MRKIRVHFSNVDFSSRTGPNTFGSRLAHELSLRGTCEIVSENMAYDLFLCFIQPASRPKEGCKLIHRLDGIWFRPDQFHTHNAPIKWAYDNAHHVVWQTEFDRTMTTKWWGEKKGSVIKNGIALDGPLGCREPFPRVGFLDASPLIACASNWHGQKRLKDNVRLFQRIRSTQHPDARLLVLGKNAWEILKTLTDDQLENVVMLGDMPHEECLKLYATADFFLHLSWLDHCPNVVTEAISQGCPVICTDSGGTKEVVGSNGIILNERVPYDFSLTDYDDPPQLDFSNFVLPAERPAVDRNSVDIKRVADRYLKVFEEVLSG